MPYATALDAEAEWFALDLSGDGVPPLHKDHGGPFDLVAARPRRQDQAPRQLFLAHGPSTPLPGSKGARRAQHEVIALVFWPNPSGGHRSHADQQALAAAADAVLARIRGPVGSEGRTHGGRWWRVNEARVEPPNAMTLLQFRDIAGAVGAGFELVVRYGVQEWSDA